MGWIFETCTFAYKTAEHESTKFSPFEPMYGRKPLLPVDIEKSGSDASDEEFDVDFNLSCVLKCSVSHLKNIIASYNFIFQNILK